MQMRCESDIKPKQSTGRIIKLVETQQFLLRRTLHTSLRANLCEPIHKSFPSLRRAPRNRPIAFWSFASSRGEHSPLLANLSTSHNNVSSVWSRCALTWHFLGESAFELHLGLVAMTSARARASCKSIITILDLKPMTRFHDFRIDKHLHSTIHPSFDCVTQRNGSWNGRRSKIYQCCEY